MRRVYLVARALSRRGCRHCYEAANRAIFASPFIVEAYHNRPTGRDLDPYNVFGFQQRKQPEAMTFKCEVKVPQALHRETKAESDHAPTLAIDERSGLLYRGLLESEVPMNLLDGLSTTIETRSVNHRGVSPGKDRGMLKLDEMYRKGRRKDGEVESPSPVRKYMTGGLVQPKLPKVSDFY